MNRSLCSGVTGAMTEGELGSTGLEGGEKQGGRIPQRVKATRLWASMLLFKVSHTRTVIVHS